MGQRRQAIWILLAALIVALTLGSLAWGVHLAGQLGDPLQSLLFRGPIAASVGVYLAACWLVLKPGAKPSIWLVLGAAAVLRLALLLGPPLLSSDVFRYVWDGRVQAAGINPYLYLPVDPALAALRDAAIFPHINRADYAPTIYPPAAQVLFAGVAAVSDSVLGMKAAMVAMEALAAFCLLRLLRLAAQPAAQLLIYAWNPVALWEFAGNGHVDAAAIGLLALALLMRAMGSRPGLAGAALGAAILTKFLPAVIAPALWRRGRFGWSVAAGALGVVVVLYAFYAAFGHAGSKVLGFLSAYGTEEGLESGSGIWLLAGLELLGPLPPWAARAYLAVAATGLAGLGAWVAFRSRPERGTPFDALRLCADAGLLATCLMVVLSPHYAWYFAWLAVPAVVAPRRSAIWLSGAAVLLYYNPLPDHFIWQSLVFAPALVFACLDLRLHRKPHRSPAAQGSL